MAAWFSHNRRTARYMADIVGSTAELRKREHENKTGRNWVANFSRAFYFRFSPTIWEPGTGYIAEK